MSAVEWSGALRGAGPKSTTANHLPGTCLRLAARGLAGGRWWTPGEATLGAVLTRAGVPSPTSEQAGDLASQVDGWALRGTLPSPEAGVLRLRVQGEHGPVFTLDRRRGADGWEYRLWTGAAPSEGPIRPPVPEAVPLHAGPPRRPAPAPSAPAEQAPVAHPGRTASSWIKPERVVSRMERGVREQPELDFEEEAPTAPPPPPPPPPAEVAAPAPLHADAGEHRGAEVLPPAPVEPITAPSAPADVIVPPITPAAEACADAAPTTEQEPEAPQTPGGDTPGPTTEQAPEDALTCACGQPAAPNGRCNKCFSADGIKARESKRKPCASEGCLHRALVGIDHCRDHRPRRSKAPRPSCATEDCERPATQRGLCPACYQRVWRHQSRITGLVPAGGAAAAHMRDKAARKLFEAVRITPVALPWVDQGDTLTRCAMSDGRVVARVAPANTTGRWPTWRLELTSPGGVEIRAPKPARGRENARALADSLLHSAGWGLV